MIVITKKRILQIAYLGIAFLFIFAFVFQFAKSDINTVSTASLPVSNKVIVLDAGPYLRTFFYRPIFKF